MSFGHVAERGADAALGGDGVAAGREHLGDAGGLQPGSGEPHGGAQAGAAGADDDDVVGVVGDRIGGGHRLSSSGRRGRPPERGGGERGQHELGGQQGDDPRASPVHVVLDHHRMPRCA